jgi:DmsE family decaheme c-type cytochrome
MRLIKLTLVAAFLLGALACFLDLKLTLAAAFAGKVQAPNKAASKKADPAAYAGSASCAECHSAEATFFALTAHAKLSDKFPVDQQGCEACHGGAKAHVEFHQTTQRLFKENKDDEANAWLNDAAKALAAKMTNPEDLPPAQATATCLKCHEGQQGRSEERFNFRRSEHHRHGVSCNDCHSSHAPKRTEYLLKGTEPNLCYQCHAEQRATFMKPFHHKVPEGGMKCSDCHNQHGTFAVKSLRNSVTGDAVCVKCHADKQGPFVYEHAPIKIEGCQACHTPHGSTNPKLLTRNTVRFLCLECHSNTPGIPDTDGTGIGPGTPSFHDITSPRYANCTVCHFEIHGSNKDPFFR